MREHNNNSTMKSCITILSVACLSFMLTKSVHGTELLVKPWISALSDIAAINHSPLPSKPYIGNEFDIDSLF